VPDVWGVLGNRAKPRGAQVQAGRRRSAWQEYCASTWYPEAAVVGISLWSGRAGIWRWPAWQGFPRRTPPGPPFNWSPNTRPQPRLLCETESAPCARTQQSRL